VYFEKKHPWLFEVRVTAVPQQPQFTRRLTIDVRGRLWALSSMSERSRVL
jgi:hypothetical protein